MNYRVGQVLYAVLNKKGHVYPMLVVEEIVKKNLRGEETSYVLQGGPNESSRLMLDQVDGDIFVSAEEAKEVLVSRATAQVINLVNSAIKKAHEWYPVRTNVETVGELHELPQKKDEDQFVKLSDGSLARLRLPEIA